MEKKSGRKVTKAPVKAKKKVTRTIKSKHNDPNEFWGEQTEKRLAELRKYGLKHNRLFMYVAVVPNKGKAEGILKSFDNNNAEMVATFLGVMEDSCPGVAGAGMLLYMANNNK